MARAAAEMRARGLGVGEPDPARQVQPDGSELRWRTAALAGGPEWRPFRIQWEQPDPERLADTRVRRLHAPHPLGDVQMRHIVIASRDPVGDAEWYARLTGHPAARKGRGGGCRWRGATSSWWRRVRALRTARRRGSRGSSWRGQSPAGSG